MKNGHGGQSGRPGEARKLYHNSKRKGLCKGKCHVLLQHDAKQWKQTPQGSHRLQGGYGGDNFQNLKTNREGALNHFFGLAEGRTKLLFINVELP